MQGMPEGPAEVDARVDDWDLSEELAQYEDMPECLGDRVPPPAAEIKAGMDGPEQFAPPVKPTPAVAIRVLEHSAHPRAPGRLGA